jgi:DNA-binding transcriptional MerR regulator
MFKIGEFSRLSRVSVRMLRHYDQLGLLKPSQTDRLTNYRYYSADQLPRLNRILALQDLGFTLEQIAGLIHENLRVEELRGMLKLKRAEVQQDIVEQESRLARLEARLRQMDGELGHSSYDVILREVGPQLVATRRAVVPDDDGLQAMFHELETYVADHDEARADKPPFTIYHDAEYRDEDIDAEVAIPLKFSITSGDLIHVAELPGLARAACVIHSGGYGTLYQAYNALLGWIESNNYRMAGPIREVYLRYAPDGLGFDLPPTYITRSSDQYVTELQLAVERS